MKNRSFETKNGRAGISRREFLTGCAACAAYASTLSMGNRKAFGSNQAFSSSTRLGGRPKIRLVFSHIPPEKPTWPNIGYDYESRKKELFAKLQQSLPNIDFSPVTVQSAEEESGPGWPKRLPHPGGRLSSSTIFMRDQGNF
jgi:hypothetical protein